ncbi:unnamed protein product [Sphagnum balticum]
MRTIMATMAARRFAHRRQAFPVLAAYSSSTATSPQVHREQRKNCPFGLLIDIDGVVCRGKVVLPGAIDAFNYITAERASSHGTDRGDRAVRRATQLGIGTAVHPRHIVHQRPTRPARERVTIIGTTPHLPVLACNTDLLWMAETTPLPR